MRFYVYFVLCVFFLMLAIACGFATLYFAGQPTLAAVALAYCLLAFFCVFRTGERLEDAATRL